ncbi:hypothetical protein V8E36_005962 [Tilletia maclaganii]
MNALIDAVLHDFATDGELGSPLPDALEAAIRRYHNQTEPQHATTAEGDEDEDDDDPFHQPRQKIDAAYCGYVWRLLCRRGDISIAVWSDKPAATTTTEDSQPSPGESPAAGPVKSRRASKKKVQPRSSAKIEVTLPGLENLTPVAGDAWRTIPLHDLISQHTSSSSATTTPNQTRKLHVICSLDLIKNALAPGRVHELKMPMLWIYLQLIARSKAEGMQGSQLLAQLGIAGTASHYVATKLADVGLVTKFSTRETRMTSTVLVHNKFRDECVFWKRRLLAQAISDGPDAGSRESESEEDESQAKSSPKASKQAKKSSNKGKAKAVENDVDDSLAMDESFLRLTPEVREALALIDAEPNPRLVEDWMPVRKANAPGNQILIRSRLDADQIAQKAAQRAKLRLERDGRISAGDEGQDGEAEDAAVDHDVETLDGEADEAGAYEELQDTADLNADADAEMDGDDNVDDQAASIDVEEDHGVSGKEHQSLPYSERKVAYYTWSTMPKGTYSTVTIHRWDTLVYRILKLLSLSPMGAMPKLTLRSRVGVPRGETVFHRKRITRDFYRIFNTAHLIEPVVYSYLAHRRGRTAPASRGDARSDSAGSEDEATDGAVEAASSSSRSTSTRTLYHCWRITEKGREYLKEVENKRLPLEAEYKRQLDSVRNSALLHEVPFERTLVETVDAAGAQGIMKMALWQAMTADRGFYRYHDRLVHFLEIPEPTPLLDTALVTLTDRIPGVSSEIFRFFTTRTLLLRSALEDVDLWTGPRTLEWADVDSKGGTVGGVGVGGWLKLLGEERWETAKAAKDRWKSLGVGHWTISSIMGRPRLDSDRSRKTAGKNQNKEESEEDDDDEEFEDVDGDEDQDHGGDHRMDLVEHHSARGDPSASFQAGEASSSQPASRPSKRPLPSNSSLAEPEAKKPKKKRGRPRKDAAQLKDPAQVATSSANLDAERQAAEEARVAQQTAAEEHEQAKHAAQQAAQMEQVISDARMVADLLERQAAMDGGAATSSGPGVTGISADLHQSAPPAAPSYPPPAAGPGTLLALAHEPTRAAAVSTSTEAPPIDPALQPDLHAGPSAEPPGASNSQDSTDVGMPKASKRVRIEVPAPAVDQGGPSKVTAEQSNSLSQSAPKDKKTSRMSLWELRREAAIVAFLREVGNGCFRDDRFRSYFSQFLIANPQYDAAEMRPLGRYAGMRHDFVRRSAQLDMVHISLMDEETQRPRQVGIVYLTSMDPAKLQGAIRAYQEEGFSATPETSKTNVGSTAQSEQEGSASESGTVGKRLPRLGHMWSEARQVIAGPDINAPSALRQRRKRRAMQQPDTTDQKDSRQKKSRQVAVTELKRQARAAKRKRQENWDATWARVTAPHTFSDHQRAWLEESIASAAYRYLHQIPSARFMNIEQLMRKRIEHALSVPEDQLIVLPKVSRKSRKKATWVDEEEPGEDGQRRRRRRLRPGPSTRAKERESREGEEEEGGRVAVRQKFDFFNTFYSADSTSADGKLQGRSGGDVRSSRRGRYASITQFELDELTRDLGVILTCRDRERTQGRTNWSALRQLGIDNVQVFKKLFLHLKSFPAEDAYLRKLEMAWWETWRTHRGTDALPDHDPAHPTDFNLKLHLEFLRKHVNKNQVTSMTLPVEDDLGKSTSPLEEWIDEDGAARPAFEDLYVSEAVCVQGNRLKSFLSWPFLLNGRTVEASGEATTSERSRGLALTTIKVLLRSQDDSHSAYIVPFLAAAVGREPIEAGLQELLTKGIIRPAHVEGRLKPVLNFDFTQDYINGLNGLGVGFSGAEFVDHAEKMIEKMRTGQSIKLDAGCENEDAGAFLHLISTGKIELDLDLPALHVALEDLPITGVNARNVVDDEIGVAVLPSFAPGIAAADALDDIVKIDWDQLLPRWACWLNRISSEVEKREAAVLEALDSEARTQLAQLLKVVKAAGPDGLDLAHLLSSETMSGAAEFEKVVHVAVADEEPILFWTGYDKTRLCSALFTEAWALPRPPSKSDAPAATAAIASAVPGDASASSTTAGGFFVPRAWSDHFGDADSVRRRECVNAVLTDCKYRPGNNLAQLQSLFGIVLSRLDILDVLVFLDRVGLVQLRCLEWTGETVLLHASSDADISVVPTNKLWWQEVKDVRADELMTL